MRSARRVALLCGGIPLVAGVAIFLLWLMTSWQWLMFAGFATLYGGLGFFAIGSIALARYYWLAARASDVSHRLLWRSMLCYGGLLLVNFPVAGGIIAAVYAIESRYVVVIHNASQVPLTQARVSGGGCEISFETIPPGQVAQRSFWIKTDGQLRFQGISGDKIHSQIIDDYVTNNQGDRRTITISSDGTLSVSPPRLGGARD